LFRNVVVTVGSVSGTASQWDRPVFSWDTAVASQFDTNAPHSGSTWLTVTGLNFGIGEHTATAGLERGGVNDRGVCLTASWTTSTTLMCLSNELGDLFRIATVTVGALVGTARNVIFSFDAAVVSDAQLNTPHSGFASLTVSGLDFGQTTHSPSAALEQAGPGQRLVCGTSAWTSSTTITCRTNFR